MKIIKRNGQEADFELSKIGDAIKKANNSVPEIDKITDALADKIADEIDWTRVRSVAIAGSGKVVAAAPPYGRFLYKGKVMVDENTGSTWARKGAKKVLVSKYTGKTNAKENLEFSKATNPKSQPEWFEAAKASHGRKWIKDTKAIAGGG